jgi:ornithine decarboxylase
MASRRFRLAVAPVRRRVDAAPQPRMTVDAAVAAERPTDPMHCLRPAVIAEAAAAFVEAFPGDVLYAVKCNPEPRVLRALWQGGVRHFDCASPAEVALVRSLFADAAIHYMHPVKARPAIREAYATHGVRDFSLDSVAELRKILDETGGSGELGLFIRLALPKGSAVYDLSGKFGAEMADAVELLRAARVHARTLGVCFHVGSQCLDPVAYARAVALAGEVVKAAGVAIDVIDVGGGFAVSYPGVTPPPLGAYMAEIEAAVERLDLPVMPRLWAEPGRALVAGGTSVVVQVQHRRGAELFINDGVYGSLSDAGIPAFKFPVRLIRDGREVPVEEGAMRDFAFFGPTCDSVDRMNGPFPLPDDVREGDWIEIGQLGAYGASLRTAFNGFDHANMVEVVDRPMLETPGLALVA